MIDLFAGPGGLGEGFASLRSSRGSRAFQISLSIEKDPGAHATLLLRSFFRTFGDAPPTAPITTRCAVSMKRSRRGFLRVSRRCPDVDIVPLRQASSLPADSRARFVRLWPQE